LRSFATSTAEAESADAEADNAAAAAEGGGPSPVAARDADDGGFTGVRGAKGTSLPLATPPPSCAPLPLPARTPWWWCDGDDADGGDVPCAVPPVASAEVGGTGILDGGTGEYAKRGTSCGEGAASMRASGGDPPMDAGEDPLGAPLAVAPLAGCRYSATAAAVDGDGDDNEPPAAEAPSAPTPPPLPPA